MFTIQSCSTIGSENDEFRELCESILKNPDTLDVLQYNTDITDSDFRKLAKYWLLSEKEHIKSYFSNGYVGGRYRKYTKGVVFDFLDYEFFGDPETRPGSKKSKPACVYFVFGKYWWECKWKLVSVQSYKPQLVRRDPEVHTD